MSVVKLSESTFQVLPQGETILQVVDIDYNEKFGKLIIKCQDKSKISHNERFCFIGANGQPNEKAINAFSYVARNIMGDMSISEIDPSALIGKFFSCKVEHQVQPNKNDPEKTVTFAHISDIRHAEGFGDGAPATTPTAQSLLSILG